ncbi:aminoacyl-tRNA deacylase [Candidatus Bathyarchaeota archaeon]|nr:aminoacyl-tRNA deacylase [Candidatus Bathyarchaeota archaeon]
MSRAANFEEYLQNNRIWHRFIQKTETVHTSDAAKSAGVDLHKLTKNLVSETDEGERVLLIVPGDRKVDLKAAATALKAKNVRLVPFDKAEEISGYPPGGTPSVGHKTRMRVVVDEELLKFETVFCGGGSRDKLVELRTVDVIKYNDAKVAKISTQ